MQTITSRPHGRLSLAVQGRSSRHFRLATDKIRDLLQHTLIQPPVPPHSSKSCEVPYITPSVETQKVMAPADSSCSSGSGVSANASGNTSQPRSEANNAVSADAAVAEVRIEMGATARLPAHDPWDGHLACIARGYSWLDPEVRELPISQIPSWETCDSRPSPIHDTLAFLCVLDAIRNLRPAPRLCFSASLSDLS
jgi:hypothetical protein